MFSPQAYLSKLIEDNLQAYASFESSVPSIGVYMASVKLNSISLHQQVVELGPGLHLNMVYGHIDEIQVQVPWIEGFKSGAVKAVAEDCRIVLMLEIDDSEETHAAACDEKMNLLSQEVLKILAEGEETVKSWITQALGTQISQLLLRIASGFSLSLDNVTISILLPSGDNCYAHVMLKIDALEVDHFQPSSSDKEVKGAFLYSKEFSIRGLGVKVGERSIKLGDDEEKYANLLLLDQMFLNPVCVQAKALWGAPTASTSNASLTSSHLASIEGKHLDANDHVMSVEVLVDNFELTPTLTQLQFLSNVLMHIQTKLLKARLLHVASERSAMGDEREAKEFWIANKNESREELNMDTQRAVSHEERNPCMNFGVASWRYAIRAVILLIREKKRATKSLEESLKEYEALYDRFLGPNNNSRLVDADDEAFPVPKIAFNDADRNTVHIKGYPLEDVHVTVESIVEQFKALGNIRAVHLRKTPFRQSRDFPWELIFDGSVSIEFEKKESVAEAVNLLNVLYKDHFPLHISRYTEWFERKSAEIVQGRKMLSLLQARKVYLAMHMYLPFQDLLAARLEVLKRRAFELQNENFSLKGILDDLKGLVSSEPLACARKQKEEGEAASRNKQSAARKEPHHSSEAKAAGGAGGGGGESKEAHKASRQAQVDPTSASEMKEYIERHLRLAAKQDQILKIDLSMSRFSLVILKKDEMEWGGTAHFERGISFLLHDFRLQCSSSTEGDASPSLTLLGALRRCDETAVLFLNNECIVTIGWIRAYGIKGRELLTCGSQYSSHNEEPGTDVAPLEYERNFANPFVRLEVAKINVCWDQDSIIFARELFHAVELVPPLVDAKVFEDSIDHQYRELKRLEYAPVEKSGSSSELDIMLKGLEFSIPLHDVFQTEEGNDSDREFASTSSSIKRKGVFKVMLKRARIRGREARLKEIQRGSIENIADGTCVGEEGKVEDFRMIDPSFVKAEDPLADLTEHLVKDEFISSTLFHVEELELFFDQVRAEGLDRDDASVSSTGEQDGTIKCVTQEKWSILGAISANGLPFHPEGKKFPSVRIDLTCSPLALIVSVEDTIQLIDAGNELQQALFEPALQQGAQRGSLEQIVGLGLPSTFRAGDWICQKTGCGHHNFAYKRTCENPRCDAPKPQFGNTLASFAASYRQSQFNNSVELTKPRIDVLASLRKLTLHIEMEAADVALTDSTESNDKRKIIEALLNKYIEDVCLRGAASQMVRAHKVLLTSQLKRLVRAQDFGLFEALLAETFPENLRRKAVKVRDGFAKLPYLNSSGAIPIATFQLAGFVFHHDQFTYDQRICLSFDELVISGPDRMPLLQICDKRDDFFADNAKPFEQIYPKGASVVAKRQEVGAPDDWIPCFFEKKKKDGSFSVKFEDGVKDVKEIYTSPPQKQTFILDFEEFDHGYYEGKLAKCGQGGNSGRWLEGNFSGFNYTRAKSKSLNEKRVQREQSIQIQIKAIVMVLPVDKLPELQQRLSDAKFKVDGYVLELKKNVDSSDSLISEQFDEEEDDGGEDEEDEMQDDHASPLKEYKEVAQSASPIIKMVVNASAIDSLLMKGDRYLALAQIGLTKVEVNSNPVLSLPALPSPFSRSGPEFVFAVSTQLDYLLLYDLTEFGSVHHPFVVWRTATPYRHVHPEKLEKFSLKLVDERESSVFQSVLSSPALTDPSLAGRVYVSETTFSKLKKESDKLKLELNASDPVIPILIGGCRLDTAPFPAGPLSREGIEIEDNVVYVKTSLLDSTKLISGRTYDNSVIHYELKSMLRCKYSVDRDNKTTLCFELDGLRMCFLNRFIQELTAFIFEMTTFFFPVNKEDGNDETSDGGIKFGNEQHMHPDVMQRETYFDEEDDEKDDVESNTSSNKSGMEDATDTTIENNQADAAPTEEAKVPKTGGDASAVVQWEMKILNGQFVIPRNSSSGDLLAVVVKQIDIHNCTASKSFSVPEGFYGDSVKRDQALFFDPDLNRWCKEVLEEESFDDYSKYSDTTFSLSPPNSPIPREGASFKHPDSSHDATHDEDDVASAIPRMKISLYEVDLFISLLGPQSFLSANSSARNDTQRKVRSFDEVKHDKPVYKAEKRQGSEAAGGGHGAAGGGHGAAGGGHGAAGGGHGGAGGGHGAAGGGHGAAGGGHGAAAGGQHGAAKTHYEQKWRHVTNDFNHPSPPKMHTHSSNKSGTRSFGELSKKSADPGPSSQGSFHLRVLIDYDTQMKVLIGDTETRELSRPMTLQLTTAELYLLESVWFDNMNEKTRFSDEYEEIFEPKSPRGRSDSTARKEGNKKDSATYGSSNYWQAIRGAPSEFELLLVRAEINIDCFMDKEYFSKAYPAQSFLDALASSSPKERRILFGFGDHEALPICSINIEGLILHQKVAKESFQTAIGAGLLVISDTRASETREVLRVHHDSKNDIKMDAAGNIKTQSLRYYGHADFDFGLKLKPSDVNLSAGGREEKGLTRPFQLTYYNTEFFGTCNIGLDFIELNLKNLELIWLITDYFACYYTLPEFGNPFVAQYVNEYKHKPAPFRGMDTRVFVTRPHICVMENPLNPISPSLVLETPKGLFYRNMMDSDSAIKMDLRIFDLAAVLHKNFNSLPSQMRGKRGSAGSGNGIQTLIEFLNCAYVSHFDARQNHSDVQLCIHPTEIVTELGVTTSGEQFPGTEYLNFDNQHFCLAEIDVEKEEQAKKNSEFNDDLGAPSQLTADVFVPKCVYGKKQAQKDFDASPPRYCNLVLSYDDLDFTTRIITDFIFGKAAVKAAGKNQSTKSAKMEEDGSSQHNSADKKEPPSMFALVSVSHIKIIIVDNVLGLHLPLIQAFLKDFKLNYFNKTSVPASPGSLGGTVSMTYGQVCVWADYFNNLKKCWEPLLEELKANLLLEESGDIHHGKGFALRTEDSIHFNISGAFFTTLCDLERMYKSTNERIAERRRKEAEEEKSGRNKQEKSRARNDTAIEGEKEGWGESRDFVHLESPALTDDARFGFSLRNSTGQPVRFFRESGDGKKPPTIYYIEDGKRGALNFVASTSRVRNSNFVIEAFDVQLEPEDDISSSLEHNKIQKTIMLQVSGYKILQPLKADELGVTYCKLERVNSGGSRPDVTDWKIENALRLVAEVVHFNGGRMLHIRSVFTVVNNTNHKLELMAFDKKGLGPGKNDERRGDVVKKLEPGEKYYVPLALLHKSAAESMSLGFLKLRQCHDVDSPGDKFDFSHEDIDLSKIVDDSIKWMNLKNKHRLDSAEETEVKKLSKLQLKCHRIKDSNIAMKEKTCSYSVEIQRNSESLVDVGNKGRNLLQSAIGVGAAFMRSKATEAQKEHSPLHYNLVIHPPIILENLLPTQGHFTIMYDDEGSGNDVLWEKKLDPGQAVPIYEVSLVDPLKFKVQLSYTSESVPIRIHDGDGAKSATTVLEKVSDMFQENEKEKEGAVFSILLNQATQAKYMINLNFENTEGGGGERRIVVFSPYWLVNTSQYELRFCAESSRREMRPAGTDWKPTDATGGAKVDKTIFPGTKPPLHTEETKDNSTDHRWKYMGKETRLDAGELRTLDELKFEEIVNMAYIFNFPDEHVRGKDRVCVNMENSEWSSPFSLDTLGPPLTISVDDPDRGTLEIGYKISLAPGKLAKYTKIVRFLPRLVIRNCLNRDVKLIQPNAFGNPIELPIGAECAAPFHMPAMFGDRKLAVRVLGKNGNSEPYEDTVHFDIETIGTFTLIAEKQVDLSSIKHYNTRNSPDYKAQFEPNEEIGLYFETSWSGQDILVKGLRRGAWAATMSEPAIQIGDSVIAYGSTDECKDWEQEAAPNDEFEAELGRKRDFAKVMKAMKERDKTMWVKFRTVEENIRLNRQAAMGSSKRLVQDKMGEGREEDEDEGEIEERIVLKLQLQQKESCTFITIERPKRDEKPEYRIENKSFSHVIHYKQKDVPGTNWSTLEPGCVDEAYYWENTFKPHILLVRAGRNVLCPGETSQIDTDFDNLAGGYGGGVFGYFTGALNDHVSEISFDKVGGKACTIVLPKSAEEDAGGELSAEVTFSDSTKVLVISPGFISDPGETKKSESKDESKQERTLADESRSKAELLYATRFVEMQIELLRDMDNGLSKTYEAVDGIIVDSYEGGPDDWSSIKDSIENELDIKEGITKIFQLLLTTKDTEVFEVEIAKLTGSTWRPIAEKILGVNNVQVQDALRFSSYAKFKSFFGTRIGVNQVKVDVLGGKKMMCLVQGKRENVFCRVELVGNVSFFSSLGKRAPPQYTYVCEESKNPSWIGQSFFLDVPHEATKKENAREFKVRVSVWGTSILGPKHKFLGQADIGLECLKAEDEISEQFFPLRSQMTTSTNAEKGASWDETGSIQLSVRWVHSKEGLLKSFKALLKEKIEGLETFRDRLTDRKDELLQSATYGSKHHQSSENFMTLAQGGKALVQGGKALVKGVGNLAKGSREFGGAVVGYAGQSVKSAGVFFASSLTSDTMTISKGRGSTSGKNYMFEAIQRSDTSDFSLDSAGGGELSFPPGSPDGFENFQESDSPLPTIQDFPVLLAAPPKSEKPTLSFAPSHEENPSLHPFITRALSLTKKQVEFTKKFTYECNRNHKHVHTKDFKLQITPLALGLSISAGERSAIGDVYVKFYYDGIEQETIGYPFAPELSNFDKKVKGDNALFEFDIDTLRITGAITIQYMRKDRYLGFGKPQELARLEIPVLNLLDCLCDDANKKDDECVYTAYFPMLTAYASLSADGDLTNLQLASSEAESAEALHGPAFFKLKFQITNLVRDEEKLVERKSLPFYGRIQIPSLSLAVVDSQNARELVHVSVRGFDCRYASSELIEETSVVVMWLQADNQLPNALSTVLLAPTPKKYPQPTIACNIRKSTKNSSDSLASYENIAMRIQSLDVHLEQQTVIASWSLIKTWLQERPSDDKMEMARMMDGQNTVLDFSKLYDMLDKDVFTANEQESPANPSNTSRRESTRKKSLSSADVEDLAARSSENHKVYISELFIGPIQINISFIMTPDLETSTARTEKRQRTVMGEQNNIDLFSSLSHFLSQVGEVALDVTSSISDSPIMLGQLRTSALFETDTDFEMRLRKHYFENIMFQLYKVVGSIDLVGNPTALVSSLGTGVKDFFYEPSKAILKNPTDINKIGRGVYQGTVSLVSNTTDGMIGTGTTITKSFGRGMAMLAMDPAYMLAREELQRAPKKTSEHFTRPIKDIGNGIYGGVVGLVKVPYNNWKREKKLSSIPPGIAKGIAGCIAKPIVGLLDAATHTGNSIRDGVKHVSNTFTSDPVHRFRLSCQFGPDGRMMPYSFTNSLGELAISDLERAKNESIGTAAYDSLSFMAKAGQFCASKIAICRPKPADVVAVDSNKSEEGEAAAAGSGVGRSTSADEVEEQGNRHLKNDKVVYTAIFEKSKESNKVVTETLVIVTTHRVLIVDHVKRKNLEYFTSLWESDLSNITTCEIDAFNTKATLSLKTKSDESHMTLSQTLTGKKGHRFFCLGKNDDSRNGWGKGEYRIEGTSKDVLFALRNAILIIKSVVVASTQDDNSEESLSVIPSESHGGICYTRNGKYYVGAWEFGMDKKEEKQDQDSGKKSTQDRLERTKWATKILDQTQINENKNLPSWQKEAYNQCIDAHEALEKFDQSREQPIAPAYGDEEPHDNITHSSRCTEEGNSISPARGERSFSGLAVDKLKVGADFVRAGFERSSTLTTSSSAVAGAGDEKASSPLQKKRVLLAAQNDTTILPSEDNADSGKASLQEAMSHFTGIGSRKSITTPAPAMISSIYPGAEGRSTPVASAALHSFDISPLTVASTPMPSGGGGVGAERVSASAARSSESFSMYPDFASMTSTQDSQVLSLVMSRLDRLEGLVMAALKERNIDRL